MSISSGACWSESLFFEFCFWDSITHLWSCVRDRRDLITVLRQSRIIHSCAQNGCGQCAGKPVYGRRNRPKCEHLIWTLNHNWCNKSPFNSWIVVYLYTDAFVKCNFILLVYSGRGGPHSQKRNMWDDDGQVSQWLLRAHENQLVNKNSSQVQLQVSPASHCGE